MMNQPLNIALPDKLEPYRKAIASTVKPYLKLKLTPDQTQWWQSKIGGLPYFPKGIEYPKNPDGEALSLLAQFNCTEMPSLEDFPSQGILQFYIDANDDFYGLDFDNPFNQDRFRILYFPEIEQNTNNLITDFKFLENISHDFSPLRGEFSIAFTLTQSPITVDDFQFRTYLPEEGFELMEIYENWFCQHFWQQEPKHQLGGYPNFTQEDPRFDPQYEDYILLLQIDSAYYSLQQEICWGDVGIGNFFIKKEELRELNFSQVLYNWDCS